MRLQASRPILIVDDDPSTRELLEGLLQGANYRTLSAPDWAEAELLVQQNALGLVLLDVYLPDGNGIVCCEQLRAMPTMEGVPILMISADHDTSVKIKGFDAGAADYITKPISKGELLARVRTHLRLREDREMLTATYGRNMELLGNLQQLLMPLPSDLPDARFQVMLRQCHMAGGDFYDVLPLSEHVTDYIIADVSGHDISTSLWTGAFKALLMEYAQESYTPTEILHRLNNTMCRLLPESFFFTVAYLRLDRKAGRAMLTNAGHPAPIWVRAADGEARVLEQESDLLGVFEDAVFGEDQMEVVPGDRLYLYTDGIIEQHGTRTEGLARLVEACHRTKSEHLDDAVFMGFAAVGVSDQVEDDVVLLGTEV